MVYFLALAGQPASTPIYAVTRLLASLLYPTTEDAMFDVWESIENVVSNNEFHSTPISLF